jgi:hypothetical protein
MVVEAGCTLTDAVPDLVGSWVLVAVTVTLATEDGAVKTPFPVHNPSARRPGDVGTVVTEPFTVAVHCEFAFTAIVEGGAGSRNGSDGRWYRPVLDPPPQANSTTRSNDIIKVCGNGCLKHLPLRSRRELPI